MYRRVPPAPNSTDPLAVYRRLTPRDRLLMSWLAEHYLLSTDQIHRALFTARRTAQMRLTILHRLHVLHRFAFSTAHGGPETSYLYTLGRVGLRRHPHAFSDPDNLGLKAPRSSTERADRIAHSRRLAHLLGVNQFFVDLHAHTRTNTDAHLVRWWSEQHATAAYHRARIYPDGHGIWRTPATTVGFFLEHDRGTENLARVIGKLKGYERLARYGPRYPVLLWLPDQRRETNLLRLLHGVPTLMPVATAVHCDTPAAPIWALTSDPFRRRALHELPSDPGPDDHTTPPSDDLLDDIDDEAPDGETLDAA